jgi:four helix bundle protein
VQREAAKSFQDLIVWQKSHALVLEIYRVSAAFPKSETYGLTSQLRRAAVSIPANIAEGFKKRGRVDKARFVNIAQASLEETRYYVILATDLDYLKPGDLKARLDDIARLLSAYSRSLLTTPP